MIIDHGKELKINKFRNFKTIVKILTMELELAQISLFYFKIRNPERSILYYRLLWKIIDDNQLPYHFYSHKGVFTVFKL